MARKTIDLGYEYQNEEEDVPQISEEERQLILQKAAEDLKKKQEREAEEKKRAIEARVPKITLDGLNEEQLRGKVKELYEIVCRLEEEKYDWEIKIGKQEFELNELNIKVNDIKGKFIKPVLKKVAKTEQRMAKVDKTAIKQKGFREQLKSTGQSKFTIEEEEKAKPEWGQDKLKSKEDHAGHAEKAAEEAEEEEEDEEEEEEEEE